MVSKSNPDVFVFYYNFVNNIENIAQILRDRHVDGKPKKIIFALNVGKSNGGTYVGNSVIGKQLLSGSHFSMGVYCTEQNAFYGDSQGWPMPDSVEQELKWLICLVFGQQTVQRTVLSMCHSPNNMHSYHSCDNNCWRYFPLQTCSNVSGVSVRKPSPCAASFGNLRWLPHCWGGTGVVLFSDY